MAKVRLQGGGATPEQIRDGYVVRWSRAPDGKNRNYAEVFHKSPGFDALDLISQDVANSEFKVYDKAQFAKDPGKAKPVENHPLIALLEDPCPGHKEIDGYMLKYITSAYLSFAGEFFWIIERNAQGYPAALYPCSPSWMVQTWSIAFPYYRVLPQGVTSAHEIVVAGDDVVWFKNPNLSDPFGRGRGRDEAIGDELESDEYAAKYQKNLFFNDGQPPMLITLPDADAATTEALKESWIQKVGGWLNARKPMFLNTKADVQKLTDSVREMDMVESRKALRDIFNQHFALPPEMRGILENSNRSTIDSADYLYKKNVLTRHAKRFAQIITRQLLSQFDDRLVFAAVNLVSEDVEIKKKDALELFKAGLLLENEVRRAFGFEEAPDGNIRLRPNSVGLVLAGEGEEKPEPIVPPAPVPPAPPAPKGKKGYSPESKAAFWYKFDQKAADVETQFAEAVKRMSARQSTMFKAQFDAGISKGMPPGDALDAAVSFVFGTKMDIETFNALAPSWVKALREGSTLAADLIGASANFELLNPLFQQWVKDHGLEMAKEINGTTQEYLRNLRGPIEEAIKRGDSIDSISGMLSHEFDKLSTTRAQLIARTETLSSVNYGQFETYRLAGIKRKEWLATPDGDTRHDHAQADGQIVGIDEAFTVGGYKMQYPGDGSSAPAGEICNCFLPDAIPEGVFVAASKSWYSGKIRIITTRSGKRLPVTINHPILTDCGWVKAGNLQKGMNAISNHKWIGNGMLSNPDNQNGPASIKDIFDTFRSNGTIASKRGGILDFNGDGPIDNSDIEAVSINGELPFAFNAVGNIKRGNNIKFIPSVPDTLVPVGVDGSGDKLRFRPLSSSNGIMSGFGLTKDLSGVLFDFGPFKAFGIGTPAQWDAGFNEMAHQSNPNDPGFLGKLVKACSGQVSTDEIIDIVDDEFTGHVYDLQSVDNYIMCNGIVSKNCRCTVLAVVEEN